MQDLEGRKGCHGTTRVLLFAVVALIVALLGFMIYSSSEAPNPAARTPVGASPPQGEPMKPVD